MREVLEDVRRMLADGERVAIATVAATRRSAPRPVGSRLAVSSSGRMAGSVSGGCVEADVCARASEVLAGGPPVLIPYGIGDDQAFEVGLPCGGEIEVFLAPLDEEELRRVAEATEAGERLSVTTVVEGPDAGAKRYGDGEPLTGARREGDVLVENYAPPPRLMVFGAVDTARTLCRIAKEVGFETVVSDARPRFATRERIPDADDVVLGWPEAALRRYPPDDATYVVVLTHDARFDEPALVAALKSPAPYIGALGSRTTQEKRRRRLLNAGIPERELDRISGPLGLDIGASTPAETALSIMAEVLAARSGRPGGRLGAAAGPIHAPAGVA